jgi:hypothetical protein
MLTGLYPLQVGVGLRFCHLTSVDGGIESRSSVPGSYRDNRWLVFLGVGCGPKVGRLLRGDLTGADHVV